MSAKARFGLLIDMRWGERKLERMIDRCGALALPEGRRAAGEWPLPELVVPKAESDAWLARRGLRERERPVVALAPGAVGPGQSLAAGALCRARRQLAGEGVDVWVLGGPERESHRRRDRREPAGPTCKDLTGNDLRNAIIALTAPTSRSRTIPA